MEADLEELDVLASEDLLSQVWSNLLHNSIKFTPDGGHVCVCARRAGNIIECRVTDTGIGVPKEAQLHVFERFYKVDQSRSNAGSGLGLAIAKRIVELHQGRIAIESEPGTRDIHRRISSPAIRECAPPRRRREAVSLDFALRLFYRRVIG